MLPRSHRPLLLALVALGVLVAGQLAPSPAEAAFTDSDGDGAVDVVEEIFGSNPAAAASTPETVGHPYLFDTNLCGDGLDNDQDGLVDTADPGCSDGDEDIVADPVELLLGSDPDNRDNFPEDLRFDIALIAQGYPVSLCGDGGDNDGDGLTDAADPGCAGDDADGDGHNDLDEKLAGADPHNASSVPEHEHFNPGSCSDGTDNDLDGVTDGADDGCDAATNDAMADAVTVGALPYSVSTKTLDATTEPGERDPSCVFSDGEQGIAGTVWYRFVSTQSGAVVIDTTGSDFPPVVGVWAAGPQLSEVACVNAFGFLRLPEQHRLAFEAAAGQTYLIQVGRNSMLHPAAGRLLLSIATGAPPSNDDFSAAQAIASLPFSTTVDTLLATIEGDEPTPRCAEAIGNTVWYRYAPASDGYVSVDADGIDFAGATVAVYEGPSRSDLEHTGCGIPAVPAFELAPTSRLSFHARANGTYYIQAGGSLFDFGAGQGASGAPGAGGFGLGAPGGHLDLHIEAFTPPACPASPQFTFIDPLGDGAGGGRPVWDITSLSGAFTDEYLCLVVGLDFPPDPEAIGASISLDSDSDRETGYDDLVYDCQGPPGLGSDVQARFAGYAGNLLLVETAAGIDYGFGTLEAEMMRLVLPRAALGGDTSLRFAISVGDALSGFGTNDCVPNGGSIDCEGGVCAFSPFRNGDANCNGPANAIDAALVLQYGAALVSSLACPDAADVNGNGQIDSRDAALILQYVAGLIEQLPPFDVFS